MEYRKKTGFSVLLAAAAMLVSCDTDMETVERDITKPWEQDPALWEEYLSVLREYKQHEHFIVYARMLNAPDVATSEKDFMRCLPDSLDIVSLDNADKFSGFDREDMTVMREKGTKVLYRIDYAGRSEEFADEAALNAYLDKAIALVAAEGLDGYAFTTVPLNTGMTAAIVAKLSAAKGEGQLLVFEGSPLSVAEADRAKLDYVVLDTEDDKYVQDVMLKAIHATGFAGIEPERLLLAATIDKTIYDEERTEHAAVEEMARRVIEFGPYGGLGVYNIGGDYYGADRNYPVTRRAMQTLNPSK